MEERWRPLVGFEDCYSVSDQGRVARTATYGGKPTWRILAKRIKMGGYVTYHLCKDGVRTDPLAHRLVWRTFKGEVPAGFEINHINSKRDDARLSNLELMTRSQNAAYAFSHNARPAANNPCPGSKNGNAKLRETDIPVIWQLLKLGTAQQSIAQQFGVTQSLISRIRRGASWRHATATIQG